MNNRGQDVNDAATMRDDGTPGMASKPKVERPGNRTPHLAQPRETERTAGLLSGSPISNRFAYVPSIYVALLFFLLTLGGVYLLVRLQFLLILLFLSVLVACGIAGPVRRLERRGLGRAPAILIIYALIGAIVVV